MIMLEHTCQINYDNCSCVSVTMHAFLLLCMCFCYYVRVSVTMNVFLSLCSFTWMCKCATLAQPALTNLTCGHNNISETCLCYR